MALATVLKETGGTAANPWATAETGGTVTRDSGGGGGAQTVRVTGGRIESTNDTNPGSGRAYAGTAFADGVVIGRLLFDHVGMETHLTGRNVAAGNASVKVALRGTGMRIYYNDNQELGTVLDLGLVTNTYYRTILRFNGTTIRALRWADTGFPAASDYKTPTWDRTETSASVPTAAGQPGIGHRRATSTTGVIAAQDDVYAHAAADVPTGPSITANAGDGQNTLSVTRPTGDEREMIPWYFVRWKAGSAVADENDGTLLTGTGDGISTGIRSDGRFRQDLTGLAHTGLTNGTTYHYRAFSISAAQVVSASTGSTASATPASAAVANPTAISHTRAADLAATISLTTTTGHRVLRRAGADQPAPVSPTDAAWTLVEQVATGSGARNVSVPVPGNDSDYTVAAYAYDGTNYSPGSIRTNVFGAPLPTLHAVARRHAVMRIESGRAGFPVAEVHTAATWVEGAAATTHNGRTTPAEWRLYGPTADPADAAQGVPLPTGGWPAGSSGSFCRVDFPVGAAVRWVRFYQDLV